MGHMDSIGSMLQNRMEKRCDESDNIGVMVATQHRSLRPEQRIFFVSEISKAYIAALNMTSDTPNSTNASDDSWRF